MRWLVSPSTLKSQGILGMNQRNVGVIGKYNTRRNYRLVDNKLLIFVMRHTLHHF